MLWCKRRCGESHLKCGVVFPCFYKRRRTAVPILFFLTLTSILVSSFFPLEAAQLKVFAYNVQMVPLLRQTHVSCHFPQELLPFHIKGLVVGVVLHLHMNKVQTAGRRLAGPLLSVAISWKREGKMSRFAFSFPDRVGNDCCDCRAVVPFWKRKHLLVSRHGPASEFICSGTEQDVMAVFLVNESGIEAVPSCQETWW